MSHFGFSPTSLVFIGFSEKKINILFSHSQAKNIIFIYIFATDGFSN